MMARSAFLCFLLVAGFNLGTADKDAEACSNAGTFDCSLQEAVTSSENGGSVTLLQHLHLAKSIDRTDAVKPEKPRVDPDDMWEQVKAAVNLDNLKSQLKKAEKDATDSKFVKDLQAKYDELSEAFPDAKQIKKHFKRTWGKIKKAVSLESVKTQLQKAKDVGSDAVDALQEKADELSKKYKRVDIDEVKKNAEEHWKKVAKKLPDLDELKAKAEAAAEKFGDTAEQLSEKVTDVLGDFNESVGKQLEELEGSISDKVGYIKDNVTDKVGDIKDSVTDKVGDIQDSVADKVGDLQDAVTDKVGDLKDSVNKTLGDIPVPDALNPLTWLR